MKLRCVGGNSYGGITTVNKKVSGPQLIFTILVAYDGSFLRGCTGEALSGSGWEIDVSADPC